MIGLLAVVVAEHFCAGVEEEQAKQPQHPLKPLYHRRTGKDEHAAQHEGSEYSPEQHFVLVLALYAEVGEEHEEHKEVVHRQRFFNKVAGKKLHCHLVGLGGVEQVDGGAEQQRHSYPHGSHYERLSDAHLVLSFLTEQLEVGYQHKQHRCVENHPCPQGQT